MIAQGVLGNTLFGGEYWSWNMRHMFPFFCKSVRQFLSVNKLHACITTLCFPSCLIPNLYPYIEISYHSKPLSTRDEFTLHLL